MLESNVVLLRKSALEPPIRARMLIFDKSVQLYDEAGKDLFDSFPIHSLKVLHHSEKAVVFTIPPDFSQTLEISTRHLLLPELWQNTRKIEQKEKKNLSRLKLPVIAISILLVLVMVYYLLVSSIASMAVGFISPKKEAEFGQMIYATIMAEQQTDSTLTELVRNFITPLHLSESYKIRITVVNEEEVNAFAIPGGDIIIYKGILRQMQGPEELVALLGHEASHVNERHSLRNIVQDLTGSMMLSLVFGDMGSIGGAIAERANMLRSLSYSRSLEEDADELGMLRMVENNIDPRGMIMLMERLEVAEKGLTVPGFLSTHPVTADRKAHAKKFVLDHPFHGELQPKLGSSWHSIGLALGRSGNW